MKNRTVKPISKTGRNTLQFDLQKFAAYEVSSFDTRITAINSESAGDDITDIINPIDFYNTETLIISIVDEFEPVCKIGNTTYASLTDAIAAASDGDTIQMLANITDVSSTIEISKTITLDLNGHTISGNSSCLVKTYVDLTVTDSGTGGKIENTNGMGAVIDNYGTLTISSGTFKSGAHVIYTTNTLTISGGTFTGNTSAINSEYGTVTISGGNFTGGTEAILNRGYPVTISGGTFNQDVSAISGVTIAEGYKVTNNGGTYTVGEEVTEITKTKEIDGVEVTFTFDASTSALKDVSGTGVTYDSDNNQFTVTTSGKVKTYSETLANDEVTEILQSAVYTKTINGVEVTFTYNGKYELQSVTGEGVTYSDGKLTIGNKTYSASLSNDTVTETLESATYEIDNVEVTVKFDTQGQILSVTGKDVAYDKNNSSITISDSIYKLKLESNDVIFSKVIVFDSVEGSDSTPKSFTNSGDNLTAQINAGVNSLTDSGNNTEMNIGGGENTVTSSGENAQLEISGGTNNLTSSGDNANINLGDGKNTLELSGVSSSVTVGGGQNQITSESDALNLVIEATKQLGVTTELKSSGDNAKVEIGGGTNTLELSGDSSSVTIGGGKSKITSTGDGLNLEVNVINKLIAETELQISGANANINLGGGTNTVELSGDNANIDLGGGTNTVELSGDSSIVTVGGGENNLTISGRKARLAISRGENEITSTGEGFSLKIDAISRTVATNTIKLSGDIANIDLGGGTNTLELSGNSSNVTVGGGKNIITSSGNNSTLKINGGRNTIGLAIKSNLISLSNDVVYLNNGVNNISISRTPATSYNRESNLTSRLNFIGGTANLNFGTFYNSYEATSSYNQSTNLNLRTLSNYDNFSNANSFSDTDADDTGVLVSFADNQITSTKIKGNNVQFITANGKFTFQDALGLKIHTEDAEGKITTQVFSENAVFNEDTAEMEMYSNFTGTLTADSEVVNIDATASRKTFQIVANDNNNSIQGGSGKNTLNGGAGDDTLTGGDGKDVFVYESGNDVITDYTENKDKIKISSGTIDKFEIVDTDLIFTIGDGTLTIKDGAGKKITVIDSSDEEFTKTYTESAVYNQKLTEMTITSSASGTITAGTKAELIDATDAVANVKIVANGKNNTITAGNNSIEIDSGAGNDVLYGGAGDDSLSGGKGNDTLTGGDGADKFVYSEGKDVITDFTAEEDTIELTSGTISNASFKDSDMIFKIGSGTLTVKDGADKEIAIGDSIYYNNFVYDLNKTTLTLGKNFSGSLQATDYDENIKTINASAILKSANITGNAENNTILGGKGADTIFGGAGDDSLSGNAGNDILYGGAGDDTLTGGLGKDIFIYESGDDVITDYTAGQDTIKFSSEITSTSYSNKDLIFETENGNLKVIDAAGKKITVTDSSGKTTKQIYSETASNARTLDLFYDDNFVTDEFEIDDIAEEKVDVTEIQNKTSEIVQDENILAFDDDK